MEKNPETFTEDQLEKFFETTLKPFGEKIN